MYNHIIVSTFSIFTLLWISFLMTGKMRVIDLYWGAGFGVMAVLAVADIRLLAMPQYIVLALILLWVTKFSVLATTRHLRAKVEDPRYAKILAGSGRHGKFLVLPTVFWLQAAVQIIFALPAIEALAHPVGIANLWLYIPGLTIAIAGLVISTIADWQMEMFRLSHAPNELCTSGLWQNSRHPNYFGDTLLWWGIGLMAIAITGNYWLLLSPLLFNVLIRFITGVPLMEEHLIKTKTGYAEYQTRTPAFVLRLFKF